MAEEQPIDTGAGEQTAHPATVIGETGIVYENIKVEDGNLGTRDAIVPNGPSVP